MKLKKMHWIGIAFGAIIIIADLIFFLGAEDRNLFIFLLGIALGAIAVPFVINLTLENKREEEVNSMFLEFSRNLAESVVTGTPISRSIINMKKRNYGPLSSYVEKLANQIELGIPVHQAFRTFADDIGSRVISRAVELIGEAERSGGEIDYILESVAKSISEVEKLKKERKAAIYSLVVQGYIIFFIFIGIMLVMQFKILPLVTGAGGLGGFSGDITAFGQAPVGESAITPEQISKQFLYLLMTQGFFAGLVIGKLSEGRLKSGVKHSFILAISAFLISTGANLI